MPSGLVPEDRDEPTLNKSRQPRCPGQGQSCLKICLKMFQTHPVPGTASSWEVGSWFVSSTVPSGGEGCSSHPTLPALPSRACHPRTFVLLPGRSERKLHPLRDFLRSPSPALDLGQPALPKSTCYWSAPGVLSASGRSRALCQAQPAISQLTCHLWLPAATELTSNSPWTSEIQNCSWSNQYFCPIASLCPSPIPEHVLVHIHICVVTCTHTHAHIYTCTCIHTYTCTHARQKYTHTP